MDSQGVGEEEDEERGNEHIFSFIKRTVLRVFMFLCAHLKFKILNWLLHEERHSAYVTVLLCVFVLCCDSCTLIVCLHVPVQGTATLQK